MGATQQADGGIIGQFGNFIAALNLTALLPLANGLAALALILAALLVIIALIKRRTSLGNFVLVTMFCVVAAAMVVVDMMRPRPPEPPAPILHVLAMGLPDGLKFPIKIRVDEGDEWDVFSAPPFKKIITEGKAMVVINASTIANQLAEKDRMISETTKRLPTETPGQPPINALGG